MPLNLKVDYEDEISLPVSIHKSELSLSEIGAIVILMCMDAEGSPTAVLNRKESKDIQDAFKSLADKRILNTEFASGELKIQLNWNKILASYAAEEASLGLLDDAEDLNKIENWKRGSQYKALQKELEKRHDKK